MSAHSEALDKILEHKLGSVQEISRKTPWGFHMDFNLNNVNVEKFLKDNQEFYHTKIMHILMGEGEDVNRAIEVMEKCLDTSLKVLVLEHNPGSSDWTGNKKVVFSNLNTLETYLQFNNYIFQKKYIGKDNKSRNILYVISSIKYLDLTFLNDKNYQKEINNNTACKNGCDINKKVYALTSENYNNPNKLFSDDIVESFEKSDKIYYSVIGGLMFLDALYQITPNKINLYDISLNQCIYTSVIIDAIFKNETVGKFNKFLANPIIDNRITKMWDENSLKTSISDSIKFKSVKLCKYRWRNVLYVGIWREKYELIRKNLIDSLDTIKCLSVTELKVKPKSFIYTSNITKKLWSHLDAIVISAENPRDVPKLIKSGLFVFDDNLRRLFAKQNCFKVDFTFESYKENPSLGAVNIEVKNKRVKLGGPFETGGMVNINKNIVELLESNLRIVEIGCGTGMFSYSAAEDSTRKIVAFEPSSDTLLWAKENRSRPNIEYVDEMPTIEKNGEFDLVVSIDVIEHIKELGPWLMSISQLAPWAVFTTPNAIKAPKRRNGPPSNRFHVREFSAFELICLLKGFYKNVVVYNTKGGPLKVDDFDAPNIMAVCNEPYLIQSISS